MNIFHYAMFNSCESEKIRIMGRLTASKSKIIIRIIFLLVILNISNNCSKDTMDDTPGTGGNPALKLPGPNEVWIQGSAFSPETITVTTGTTITWTNKDGVIHTVTSNTGLFDSGNIGNNGTYSLKVTAAGTFPYFCKLHTTMTGTVVVN